MKRTMSELGTYRTPGEVQEGPAYCLGGIRHKGSANLIQALVWSVGTCRSDDKGETQVREPHKGESTDAGHGGGATRIRGKVL